MTVLHSARAIVWLRWHLLINSLRGSRRRDTLEQVSRTFATVMPMVFLALSIGTVGAVCILGFLGGRAVSVGLIDADIVVFIVRFSLVVVLGLLVVVTMASPVQTALARSERLLILPIPRQTLHLAEVLANVLDPWIAFLMPGLACFAAGFAAGGAHRAAAAALAAGVAVLAVFASAGALVSGLVGWLLRSRRRGELFMLVFVIGLSLLSFLPAALGTSAGARRRQESPRIEARTVEEFDRALPVWTRVVPTEIYGRAVLAALDGRTAAALLAIGAIVAEALVLFGLSSAVHRRALDTAERETRRRRSGSAGPAAWRVPFASPAVSAIALVEYRTTLRSVRGRLAVLLPGPMVAVLATVLRGISDEPTWLTATGDAGYLALAASLVFGLYALQPFTMNLFGADRAGLTRLFLAPATDAELARGKVAGCGLVLAMSAAVSLVAAILLAPAGPLAFWLAALAGAAATFALLAPIAVVLSALFPVAADVGRTGTGGNPHAVPMLAGTVLVAAFALPAVAIFLVNWFWTGGPLLVLALMLVWLAASVAAAVPLVTLASRVMGVRRENLALVAAAR